MRNPRPSEDTKKARDRKEIDSVIPKPTASYRRRAWVQFQRALDPLAPVKPPPPPRG